MEALFDSVQLSLGWGGLWGQGQLPEGSQQSEEESTEAYAVIKLGTEHTGKVESKKLPRGTDDTEGGLQEMVAMCAALETEVLFDLV